LELLLELGISHIIFVLDADNAGDKATERFVKLVEEHLGGHVGLKIEIVILPEGSDDPDKFIRNHGLQPFLELERLDVFSWRLRQAIRNGENPDSVIESTVALILNEPHEVKRYRMAEAVSRATGVPVQVIHDEVVRRKDEEGQKIRQEIALLADRTQKSIGKNPHALVEIIRDAAASAERIGSLRKKYDLNQHREYMLGIREQQEANLEKGRSQNRLAHV
jgi:DNA primase